MNEDELMLSSDDRSTLMAHSERISNIIDNMADMKNHINRLEQKYDVMIDIASSIKTLSTQMLSINSSVSEMKQDFKTDIRDIKDEQKTLASKVDRIEVSTSSYIGDKGDAKKIKLSIVTSLVEKIILIIFIIVILALFPHLKEILGYT